MIKVSPTEPIKKILSESDPSEDTWVMVKPITYREDMQRGEILKQRQFTETAAAQTMQGLNMYALRAGELWLTYHSCCIVLEDEEGNTSEPFKPVEEMTRREFMEALGNLPSEVVVEWYNAMLEVNPDWRFPF